MWRKNTFFYLKGHEVVGYKCRHDLRTEYVKGISVFQGNEHTRTLGVGERDTWQTKEDLAGVRNKEIVRMKLVQDRVHYCFSYKVQETWT